MGRDAEQAYETWNSAIAQVVFPELEAPAPVYLDLEDGDLEELGSSVGVPLAEVESALCRSVRDTLDLGAGDVFRRHSKRLRLWCQERMLDPPPVLAVLAVSSLAAERMSHGNGMSANNFYGRLTGLLGVGASERERLRAAYQGVAERYWHALNSWLIACGGNRGLPTAYALGHRYVGLPVSQAVVRKADRDRLPDFFQQFGLAPGTELDPGSLDPLLDYWMKQAGTPATRSLTTLWNQAAARARICQAASVALATWDGRSHRSPLGFGAADRGYHGRLALTLELSAFPVKRFSLSVLVYANDPETARNGTVLSGGVDQDVVLAPAVPGALSFGQSASFEPGNLLQGVLRVRDSHSGTVLQRPPHRLVVFRRDPLTMTWTETPRIAMGDDLVVVVQHNLSDRVAELLGTCARGGWRRVQGYRGLPDEWDVYEGVQLYAAPGELVPDKLDDLEALVPLSASQLRLSGGLSLPGSTRGRWHRDAPPEVRAVTDHPGGFVVRLVDLRDAEEGASALRPSEVLLKEWSGDGALVQPLGGLELENGDYRLDLVTGGEALSSTHLHLRSSDSPDLGQWSRSSKIQYRVRHALGALGVGTDGAPSVRGAVTDKVIGVSLRRCGVEPVPWWSTVKGAGATVPRPLLLTAPDPTSCIYTGAHRIEVDPVPLHPKNYTPLVKFSIERCTLCGISRTANNDYYANKRAFFENQQRSTLSQGARGSDSRKARGLVQRLANVPDKSQVRDWDLVLDALMHVGGGPWRYLEALARHVEPTGIFVDKMARALEALGHVDVRRDPATLQPLEWEISPRALVPTGSAYFMVGHWPPLPSNRVLEAIGDEAGGAAVHEHEDGPSSWYLSGPDVAAIATAVDEDVVIEDQAWQSMATALPSLRNVMSALPRRSGDLKGRLRLFDAARADWVDVRDLARPGAYRITGYATLDVVRGDEDVAAGTVAVSTVYLSKHLAAGLVNRPLLAYDRGSEELTVPLGADLPGLYGRAVVLASGTLPERRGRLLVYRDVPADLAHHLAALFTMEPA